MSLPSMTAKPVEQGCIANACLTSMAAEQTQLHFISASLETLMAPEPDRQSLANTARVRQALPTPLCLTTVQVRRA